MFNYFLDVAVGPIYALLGIVAVLILGVLFTIIFFAFKTIKKIKEKEQNNNG